MENLSVVVMDECGLGGVDGEVSCNSEQSSSCLCPRAVGYNGGAYSVDSDQG